MDFEKHLEYATDEKEVSFFVGKYPQRNSRNLNFFLLFLTLSLVILRHSHLVTCQALNPHPHPNTHSSSVQIGKTFVCGIPSRMWIFSSPCC